MIVVQTTNRGGPVAELYEPELGIFRYDIWGAVRGLAALFIHEARHNQGYLHTRSTGERAGQNDNTIAELGASGVQCYFPLWLGTHSNPPSFPRFRWPARQDAESMHARFFCTPSPSPTP